MKSSCSPGAGPRFGPATSRCTGDADGSGRGNGGVRPGGRYATTGEQGVTELGGDQRGDGADGPHHRRRPGLAVPLLQRGYRTAWRRRHPQPGLPKQAPFQVRLQTAADLAASRWGLLAWADPDEEDDPISPFWLKAPMLQIAISPDATPLVPGMTALAAPLSGLRLVDGDLVLKIERGRATTQLRIPAGSGLGPADGVLAQHDILLSPVAFSSHLREACALTGWEVGGAGSSAVSHWGRAASASCPGTNARTNCGSRGGGARASKMPRPGTASGSE